MGSLETQLERIVSTIVGEFGWLIIVAIFALTFKNIIQINVDLDMKGKLSVTMKSFPEIQFKFSNAGNSTSSRNKIGFKKL